MHASRCLKLYLLVSSHVAVEMNKRNEWINSDNESENDAFAEELERMQKAKAVQKKMVSPVEELIDEM